MICKHCHRDRSEYSRGLCSYCFKTPDVLALYPPKVATDPYKNFSRNYEPSMDELEAMIAERYPTMPKRGADEE